MKCTIHISLLCALVLAVGGCSHTPQQPGTAAGAKGDNAQDDGDGREASATLDFYDFEWRGTLLASSTYGAQSAIQRQLFYTVGQLNGDSSVGRMDRVEIDVTETAEQPDGKVRVTYTAKMLVGWDRNTSNTGVYTFRLPEDLTWDGERQFVETYGSQCAQQPHDHDVDVSSMWYYYRPRKYACPFRNAEQHEGVDITVATVTPSPEQTTDKFPEYHMVWADSALKVVAVFGKYEDNATDDDSGITAFNSFVRTMRSDLGTLGTLTTTPQTLPHDPGTGEDAIKDVTFHVALPAAAGEPARTIEVVALLVDNIRHTDQAFNDRYRSLTPRADLIGYNGHSGLGANIKALARKGTWEAGQYAIVYLNGCDSYAYVDSALAKAHADVNPDDAIGTKYLDTLTNAMPSYFSNMDDSMVALVKGLLSYVEGQPLDWVALLGTLPNSQRALVTGEQDNTFTPSTPPPPPPPPSGPCDGVCDGQAPSGCYCDAACALERNSDCCQADGSTGPDQAHVRQSCPALFDVD